MSKRETFPVSDELFRAVYESPASLPGEQVWVTPEEDVREIERLLGIEDAPIGAPLWLSGDERHCPKCRRQTSWLDIVASAVGEVHRKELIARVILGDQKYVNVEAPDAIAGLSCFGCGTSIDAIRSFKCHNWAYAIGDLAKIVERVAARG